MTATRNLGFVAAASTLLAAAPLSAVFQRWTWLIQAAIAVALVAGVAAVTRLIRAPLWGQALGMLGGLTIALTWLFPSGAELLTFLPAPGTFAHFGELLAASVQDMRTQTVKVDDTDPLLFVAVLGVGGVAIVVDVLTVGLRRPALAGLPMLAVYSVPVAVYVDSVPATPFVVGAAGYLWLLVADNVDRVRRFGRRFTGDGRDVDVWESSPLASAGRRLAVVGVVLAVALPLAVPGMTGGLLDRFGTGLGDGTGGSGPGGRSGRVDLFAALSGNLNQSEVVDFVKVRTTEPNPFYLRIGVADELRPDGFRFRAPTGRPVSRGLPAPTRTAPGVTQQRYRAWVEVTRNLTMALLPVYAEPVGTMDLDGDWLYDPNYQLVFSTRENSRGKRYSFEYVRSTYTPEALRTVRPLPSDHPIRLQQTATPQVAQVNDLVADLVRGKRNEYDKVRAIYDYFSADNGFTYSLSTKGGTSGQDIVDFLTNKAGYCQQYAAAMAWLVRAAGIPARVAFGFTNGRGPGDDGTYVLTNRNMHAWTEVYFDGMGWVPFDATPTYGVPGFTRSAWAPDTDTPEPSAPSPGGPANPGDADPSDAPTGRDIADRDSDQGLTLGGDAPIRQRPVWPWWSGGVLAVLLLLAAPALRRAALRRRRGSRVTAAAPAVLGGEAGRASPERSVTVEPDAERARADAHAAWDELLDTLVDYRLRVDRTETPRATAERLAVDTLTGDAAAVAAVRLLSLAEERARYARDPLTDERLHPALGTVRDALAARADRRTRLLAAALPPSVLLRWRATVADAAARTVARASDTRYRLARGAGALVGKVSLPGRPRRRLP